MTPPKFSIVIPTHNRPNHLRRAVKSLIAQDVPDSEIIVVNDGSNEDYSDFLAEFGKSVNYITQPNALGVSVARNTGVRNASGDWIVFLDDDDLMAPGYLNAVATAIKTETFDYCWCGVKFVFPPQHVGGKHLTQIVRKPAVAETQHEKIANILALGASFGLAIRKEVFEECGGFNPKFNVGEDTDLFIKLLTNEAVPYYLPCVGILKNELHTNRLTSGTFSSFSRNYAYEYLFKCHPLFFRTYPSNHKALLWWAFRVHVMNGNFRGTIGISWQALQAGFLMTSIAICTIGSLYHSWFNLRTVLPKQRSPS